MAAKFTHGGHNTGTDTVQHARVREVRGSSHVLRRGNTMSGQPGFIETGHHETGNPGRIKGGKSIAPKGPPGAGSRAGPGQGRYIGHKGSSGPFPKSSPGTMGGRAAWMGSGHQGRIERLSGHAKAFGEKGKGHKSNMY
jgi:hypothetical protein